MSVYMPLYYIPCFIWLVHFGSIPQVALRAARNLGGSTCRADTQQPSGGWMVKKSGDSNGFNMGILVDLTNGPHSNGYNESNMIKPSCVADFFWGTQTEAWDLRDLSRSQFWVTPLCDAPAVSVAILTISDIARPPQQPLSFQNFKVRGARRQIWVSILGPPNLKRVQQC